jgi:hypothetical protein
MGLASKSENKIGDMGDFAFLVYRAINISDVYWLA